MILQFRVRGGGAGACSAQAGDLRGDWADGGRGMEKKVLRDKGRGKGGVVSGPDGRGLRALTKKLGRDFGLSA